MRTALQPWGRGRAGEEQGARDRYTTTRPGEQSVGFEAPAHTQVVAGIAPRFTGQSPPAPAAQPRSMCSHPGPRRAPGLVR